MIVSNTAGNATSAAASLTVVVLSPAQLTYEPLGPSTRRTGLTFSEIMYHPAPNADGRHTEFIEIYNSNPFFEDISGWRLSGDADYTFPANTVIQGNSFLVVAPVPADVQANYNITGVLGGFTNNLPNEGGTIRLRKASGGVVLEMNYSDQPPWPVAADGTGHSLVLSRPSYGENNPRAWAASAFKGGSPGAADPLPVGAQENVVINEILAHTDLPQMDYVELFNNGSALAADLSGCWLSDNPATNKFRIPDGTTLAPRGFIAFDQTQLGFALGADGESVYLVNSNGTRVLAAVRFDGQANGIAFGRFPDGTPDLQPLVATTFGTTNAPALLRDVVINETLYNPISGNDDDEFIELHNRGAQPANIGDWRFSSGINYTFPSGTTIPAGGYLVVAKNASRLATNYAGLNGANLLGEYGGSLANGGERVALGMPDFGFTTNGTVITTNRFFIVMDEVTYLDGGRWTRWSDGGGSSLELADAHGDNRAGANWADSDDTAKSAWTTVEFTGVCDLGSGLADRVQIMLMGSGEALVDDVEVIVNGVNRVPNPGFESGATGWIFGGTHSKTTHETTEGYNSARSLHLRASDRGDLTANRLSAVLTSAVAPSSTATLRAKVRWLRGHPEILIRLKGNYLEAYGRLSVPSNLGTPGAANSQARANLGPVITDTAHRPILPQAGQAIRVTARVSDPDGVQTVTLRYRIDPDATLIDLPMLDDGTGGDARAGDGLYTAYIPGQSNGKLVAFRVEATDRFAPPATAQFPTDAPTRECLVRVGETQPPGAFGTYRLWLTSATVTTWAGREKLSNENLDGTFAYGTNRVIYNVGAHYSGSPYTSPGYTSPVGALCGYDIAFPEDEPFLSSTHVVMDWPVRDDTNQREQLMFWLLEQYGLPNMYRRYVMMFVNGVRRSVLMDDVQQPNGDTVDEFFPDDPDGALFKTDCWDEFADNGDRETGCIDLNALELYTTSGGVKKTARYRWTWKPRSIGGTANDYSQLFQLVDAANAPTNGFLSGMESLADMEHWMRTFAMNDLAAFWDAFGNPNAKNTFLYKPTNDRWKLMSWDFDVGLGVFNDPVTDPLFPVLNDTQMNRIYATPAWLRLYWCALSEGVNTFFQSGVGTRIDAILDAKFAAFQANGISLVDPAAIKSWIAQRRTFLLTQLNSVSNVFSVTGTNFISTNRNLITLTGTAPVNVHTITINGITYTPTWVTVNSWRLQIPVTAGTNELAIAALDRFGRTNSVVIRTVEYTGADELAEDNIVINEIMYNPLVPNATFIELLNRSTNYSFDLSGWRLNGVDFTFPPGTIITNRGLLVICADRGAFGTAYGWGIPTFGIYGGQLDDGGETLTLIKPGSTNAPDIVVNRVSYDDDPPWPTGADGHGTSLQLIDPDQDNSRVSNWGESTGWRLHSFTGVPGTIAAPGRFYIFMDSAGDFFIDNVSLVAGTVAGVGSNYFQNGSFETAFAGPWHLLGNHASSTVSATNVIDGSNSLHLTATSIGSASSCLYQDIAGLSPTTTYTFSFWYLPTTNGNGLNYRLTTPFRTITPFSIRPVFSTPGANNAVAMTLPPYPQLWLSEVQPENVNTIVDNFGDNDPWIELYNGTSAAMNLEGFYLANNYTNLAQWAFPAGAIINPGQYLLVWADGEPGESVAGNLHTSFRLNPTNGSVALSRLVSSAPQVVDYLNYRNVGTNRSYGAFPPGQGSFRQVLYFPTPGLTNNPAAPPVTLFINEWMAANASYLRDPADQDYDDWFEIYNPTTNRIDLEGFSLTDDFARPRKSVIPAGISIAPGSYLLVWADEESSQTQTNRDLHVSFKLSQTAEQIGLYDPAGRQIDAISFGLQTNNISQGRSPDGGAAPFRFMSVPTPRASNIIPSFTPPLLSVTYGPGNSVTLVWSAQAGLSYRVQYKDDLNAGSWNDLGNPVTASGATAQLSDTNNNSQRFYRVTLVQ